MMSTSEQVLHCGKVDGVSRFRRIIKGNYLRALCVKGQPAELEVSIFNGKYAAKNKSKKQKNEKILFHNVGNVCKGKNRKVILKSTDGSELFSFRVKSDTEQEEWIKYCKLLRDLPYYFIPEQPNYSLVPKNFTKKQDDLAELINDSEYTWLVNIIHKGEGMNIDGGLYIAADCGSTLRLYDCSTQNTLVYSWDSEKLRWFGHSGSLVFIAVRGESGDDLCLLWMDCTCSSRMCESLGKLTCKPKAVKITGHYRSRGFSDSGVIDDLDDKQDTDDDSQEQHCTDKCKFESPMQVIFSPSEDAHSMKQASRIVFTIPPSKNIHSKQTAAKETDSNNTKPIDDCSCNTAIEHSGQSNFKGTRNEDAPTNSHDTLEQQEGCLASNAHDASNIDGTNNSSTVVDATISVSEQIEKMALEESYSIICAKLDAVVLYPLLYSENLLTDIDSQFLTDECRAHVDKANYLVINLPRKRQGWFTAFLHCLLQTKDGTGHDEVYKALVSKHRVLTTILLPEIEAEGGKQFPVNVCSYEPGVMESQQCSLTLENIIEHIAPKVATKWFELGVQLGVDSEKLKIIKHDYQHESKTACMEMFMEWLENTKGEKSWEKLRRALRSQSVGQSTLANTLNLAET